MEGAINYDKRIKYCFSFFRDVAVSKGFVYPRELNKKKLAGTSHHQNIVLHM